MKKTKALKFALSALIILPVFVVIFATGIVRADGYQYLDGGEYTGGSSYSVPTVGVNSPSCNTHWTNMGQDIASITTALDNALGVGLITESERDSMLTSANECVSGGLKGDSITRGSIIMTVGSSCRTGEIVYNNVNASWAQANKNNPANDVGFDRNSDAGNGKTIQQLMDEGAQELGSKHGLLCAGLKDTNDEPDEPDEPSGSSRCPTQTETATAGNGAVGSSTALSPCSGGTCETPNDTSAPFVHTFSFIPGCHGGACSGGKVTPSVVANSCFDPLGESCSASAIANYPTTAHFKRTNNRTEKWHTEHYSCNCSTDEDGHRSCSTCSRRVFDGCEDHWTSWSWTGDSGTSTVTTSGSASNPYKYQLTPEADSPQFPIYTGEKAKAGGTVTNNDKDQSNKNTHTYSYRNTIIRLIQFTVAPNYDPNVEGGIGLDDPCLFYSRRFNDGNIWECNTVKEETRALAPNESFHLFDNDRIVPDTKPIGTKYCFAIGAYTYDSGSSGMGNPPTNQWTVSGASCSAITKKPNFEIWNNGLYTNGGITTSLSPKVIGHGLDNDSYSDATKTIFGSWEEQLAIVGGAITKFGSGNTLGYTNNAPFGLPGGISYNTDLTSIGKYSSISPLTVSNTNDTIGNANIDIEASYLLSRLDARYRPINDEVKGDFTYHGDSLGKDSGIKVIYSTGTVTIDGDICYGPCNVDSNSSALTLSDQDLSIDAISSLPQILIFAKDIKITGNVGRIDAWLIAENSLDTCSGFKSSETEAGFTNGNSAGFNTASCNRQLITNGPILAKRLYLNRTGGADSGGGIQEPGDVRTQNLTNDGSIAPAEIFNLRPDTYLWAYAQAQGFTEAVVTYSRELAPRL